MPLDSIVGWDATGGGVLTVVNSTSLTVKGGADQIAYIVGYSLDGISVRRVTVTNAANPSWDATGLVLYPTTDGTAVGAGAQWQPLKHKVPVRGGDVLVMTSLAGANPVTCILYLDYPPYGFSVRPDSPTEEGLYYSRTTVAGGTNCAAGTAVQGATSLGNFPNRMLTPVSIHANAAFTTTAMLGIRKLGTGYLTYWNIGLTDIANDWWTFSLPKGLFTVTKGDSIELFWISDTAEQQTAQIDFVYPPSQ
jgi:hypothetical protein